MTMILAMAAAEPPPATAEKPTAAESPPAADELAERALTIARRTALGVLGDVTLADDVAQEVAIIALRRAGDLRDGTKADAWLHRVASRAALREAKRGARRRAVEMASGPRAVPDPEPTALDGALELLDGLPDRQRAALTLRYVHDLTDAEIAHALRCRETTVRSLLHRGRTALRGRLYQAEVTQ